MDIRSYQGTSPLIADNVYVDPSAIVIGDVEIGEYSSIWPLAVIRGDVHGIRIGQRTSVQDGSVLHVTHAGPYNPAGFPLLIGDDVTIAHKVTLHGCTIGNRVLIGMSTTILDGATIEDEVVIGAGTLVPPGKRLQGRSLYRGSPAQRVRSLSAEELAMLRYSAEHYVRLKDRYLGD